MLKKLKQTLFGKALNPKDKNLGHKMSLIAFFAWVGLGSDGLSSSCYGPEEAFLALQSHPHLTIFVAIATALTVLVISASYSQIIELFPTGGGGYLVASKLLSPNVGMVAGCALLIDYLLTVTISIASGTDALFSFLPTEWAFFKIYFAVFGVILLTILNMRGVKESVIPLVPIFLTFIFTHLFIIVYGIFTHVQGMPGLVQSIHSDIRATNMELGLFGTLFLILRAYSLGAGTYTGLEVVSNGLQILREPRVQTGKRTMLYMSLSLAFTVLGLMVAYLLYGVHPQEGKTLNAVLFENISAHWGTAGHMFVLITLISEAFILFVAAQTGFIGGPKVLANMALDRWFASKFAALSDRLVTQKGILLMSIAAIVTMIATGASVKFLIILYSINVFITFFLSQLGMVLHWWKSRDKVSDWIKKICINGIGLFLTTFILISVLIFKFFDGGWITLLITGSLIITAIMIKRHYLQTAIQLRRLNSLVQAAHLSENVNKPASGEKPSFDPNAKTAVLMVNGFNGLGLHTLFNVIRLFGNEFRNFVFVQIGVIDAGNFKGTEEVDHLQDQVKKDVDRYVEFMNQQGYFAEGLVYTSVDIIDEIDKIGVELLRRYPQAVFFGGQLVFEKESLFTKWLHNYTVFAMQRKFYNQGIPFVVLPIRV
jgi:amino acid transporter